MSVTWARAVTTYGIGTGFDGSGFRLLMFLLQYLCLKYTPLIRSFFLSGVQVHTVEFKHLVLHPKVDYSLQLQTTVCYKEDEILLILGHQNV